MPAPEGNKFAKKPAAEKRLARLMLSFTAAEKRELMRSHGGKGRLTEYTASMVLAAVRAGLEPSAREDA